MYIVVRLLSTPCTGTGVSVSRKGLQEAGASSPNRKRLLDPAELIADSEFEEHLTLNP